MTTQQAVIVALTKLDGLTGEVLQMRADFKAEKEEREKACTEEEDQKNALDKRLTTVETYWKVAVGILIPLVPAVIAIVWDLVTNP